MKREYSISLPQPFFFQLDLLSATDNYEKYSSVVCSPMFTNSFYWDNTLNMWIADTLNVPRSDQNYAAKCLSGDYTWSMESEGFTFLMDVYLITFPTGYRFNIDFIPRYGLNVYDTSEINYTFQSNTWHKYANVWSPPPHRPTLLERYLLMVYLYLAFSMQQVFMVIVLVLVSKIMQIIGI